jgi:hypothetical protein
MLCLQRRDPITPHSARSDSTGFINAAFIACRLTVASAIMMAAIPAEANIPRNC